MNSLRSYQKRIYQAISNTQAAKTLDNFEIQWTKNRRHIEEDFSSKTHRPKLERSGERRQSLQRETLDLSAKSVDFAIKRQAT